MHFLYLLARSVVSARSWEVVLVLIVKAFSKNQELTGNQMGLTLTSCLLLFKIQNCVKPIMIYDQIRSCQFTLKVFRKFWQRLRKRRHGGMRKKTFMKRTSFDEKSGNCTIFPALIKKKENWWCGEEYLRSFCIYYWIECETRVIGCFKKDVY